MISHVSVCHLSSLLHKKSRLPAAKKTGEYRVTTSDLSQPHGWNLCECCQKHSLAVKGEPIAVHIMLAAPLGSHVRSSSVHPSQHRILSRIFREFSVKFRITYSLRLCIFRMIFLPDMCIKYTLSRWKSYHSRNDKSRLHLLKICLITIQRPLRPEIFSAVMPLRSDPVSLRNLPRSDDSDNWR